MTSALLTLILLPPLLMVSLSLPSLATGLIVSSCIILGMRAVNIFKFSICKSYLWVCAASGLWIFANPISVDNSVHAKQVLSLVAVLICGFAITSSFEPRKENLIRTIKAMFWILLIIGSMGVFDILTFGKYQLLNRPIPPFSEPSHFATAFTPVACSFALISSRGTRLLTCLACFFLAISLPNLTLLAGTVLVSMVALSGRQAIMFLMTTLIAGSVLTSMNPDLLAYFLNRTSATEADNISRLVYIQGWESTVSALHFSNGFGVGFQNLGIEPPGEASMLLDALSESQLNRSDGSFLAAKIIGEFGIFGAISVIGITVSSIRSGILLRRYVHKPGDRTLDIIALCFTYTLLMEIFVRSTGYFSPTLLITLFFAPKAINIIRKKPDEKQLNSSKKIIAK